MEEGEQKLCLAEPALEIVERGLLQVQMQLMEEMQALEALAAEAVLEARAEVVIIIQMFLRLPLLTLLLINQEQMEAVVEREVMEAAEAEEGMEGRLLKALQEREVQEILAVLEAVAEAAEMLGRLLVLMEDTIMVAMVQQEAMAEAEGVAEERRAATMIVVLMVAVALAVLD